MQMSKTQAASTTWAQHLFHLAGLNQEEIEEVTRTALLCLALLTCDILLRQCFQIKGRIRSTTDQVKLSVLPNLKILLLKRLERLPRRCPTLK